MLSLLVYLPCSALATSMVEFSKSTARPLMDPILGLNWITVPRPFSHRLHHWSASSFLLSCNVFVTWSDEYVEYTLISNYLYVNAWTAMCQSKPEMHLSLYINPIWLNMDVLLPRWRYVQQVSSMTICLQKRQTPPTVAKDVGSRRAKTWANTSIDNCWM